MYKFVIKILFLCSVGLFFINSHHAIAQDVATTPCDESQYSALAQLPDGNLTAYLKAGRKEDAVKTQLFYKVFDSDDCVEIGSAQTSHTNYVKFGGAIVSPENTFISVHVKLVGSLENKSGANYPQVVFVKTNEEPCDISAGCKINFRDQSFSLSPKKVSLSIDTVRVGVLSKLTDGIKEVAYTVDGKPAYTRPDLEKFNLNYVPDGEHTIGRTIVLKDGQSLSDSEVVKRGLEGGATYLFISILYGQSRLLRYVGIIIVFLILYSLFTYIIKHIAARRRWESEHFFNPNEHYDMSNVGARRGITGEESYGQLLRHYKKYLISSIGLIVAVFLLNSYILTIFTVDGVSMYPTLNNRAKKPLYIFPVTLGKINKNYYLPKRGSIIVIQKDGNNLFDEIENSDKKNYVVKRVVGLPNERVVIKDGKIKIFNKENEKGFEPDAEFKWVRDLTGSENLSMNIKLKEGELFVVGDNRDESIDSRFYGPVQTSQVIGQVL